MAGVDGGSVAGAEDSLGESALESLDELANIGLPSPLFCGIFGVVVVGRSSGDPAPNFGEDEEAKNGLPSIDGEGLGERDPGPLLPFFPPTRFLNQLVAFPILPSSSFASIPKPRPRRRSALFELPPIDGESWTIVIVERE
jgi:hypothetical protein